MKNRHPDAWAHMTAHGNRTLAAGLMITGLTFWLFIEDRYGFAATVIGFPLLAIGFGLLILAALSQRSWLRDLRIPGAGRLAVWSYAIYLTHRGASAVAAAPLQKLGYGPQTGIAIMLLLALSVLSGWILYRLVETPFMALRERYVPSNLAPSSLRLDDVEGHRHRAEEGQHRVHAFAHVEANGRFDRRAQARPRFHRVGAAVSLDQ